MHFYDEIKSALAEYIAEVRSSKDERAACCAACATGNDLLYDFLISLEISNNLARIHGISERELLFIVARSLGKAAGLYIKANHDSAEDDDFVENVRMFLNEFVRGFCSPLGMAVSAETAEVRVRPHDRSGIN